MTKIQVEFVCRICGLMTVGVAEVPDDAKPHQKITFGMNCHHCGRAVMTVMTARKARTLSADNGSR